MCEPGCTCGKHGRAGMFDWNDPEARKVYNRQYAAKRYAADPERFREVSRQWRRAHPGRDGSHREWRKKLYRVSLARMAEMLAEQDNCCYLCAGPLDTETPRKIHVDHDHSCCRGERSCGRCVRGLACESCNIGIANFGDDPERMRRVADNLEKANRRVGVVDPEDAP